jgi:CRISPR/Cas system CSM-associated protein Csm4 (group 5 of RAMP superfamily)
MGQFTFEQANNPFHDFIVSDANAGLSTSLYCPESPAQAEQALHYQLIRRGGWITDEGLHTYRKKNVYMFKEGSLFTFKHNNLFIEGNAHIDLTPPNLGEKNRVLRCGKAIFLPCKISTKATKSHE